MKSSVIRLRSCKVCGIEGNANSTYLRVIKLLPFPQSKPQWFEDILCHKCFTWAKRILNEFKG